MGRRIPFRTLALKDPCDSWVSQSGVTLTGLAWAFHSGAVDKKMLFKTMTMNDLIHLLLLFLIKVIEGCAG